ncbi:MULTISPECIES: TOBE domain-containing protein [Asticcacaulis]|uniref:TOBE domain-containing protein n=1 Tax=Asticcacaulis TaxID=76890 RepID=UPI001AE7A3CD|nr:MULTISPECIES: TOBE domain-containing protein [Asticcacaulis]MBP2161704.1 molybdate transport system regulatory protein [Asticcacaulis solisilvae]MDR6802784.1 molybdate transport system regulatory protein [Asticcacaulis sp. BE141]
MSDLPLKALLHFRKGDDSQIGEGRIRLLRLIGELGSISAAAKAAGLSYKGAWDAVQALNNLSARPLIVAQTGGKSGGAATVTEEGRALINAYAALEDALAAQMEKIDAVLNAGADVAGLLRRLNMKTTARNAWSGTVTHVTDGAVNAGVAVKVADGIELTAVVTRESVEELGLKVGRAVTVLIKSSFVILATGHDPLPISARNRILGVVSAVVPGAVNDEVTLDIGSGKTVTAVVTHESTEALDFTPGKKAQALIKASHIILAVD